MIPPYLLNSTVTFFQEANPTGTFGQPTKELVEFASARCRLDMTSENRQVDSGSFEQRQRRFTVFVNQLPPQVNTKTWLEVVADSNGFTLVGQVASVASPGLMGHHSELTLVEQPPSVPSQGGTFKMVRKTP